jgi:hypothetical protein
MLAELLVRCAKVRYASRREAEQDAATHHLWQPRCPKCLNGQPFEVYRCPDAPSSAPHHHLGHGWPSQEEEPVAMTTSAPTDSYAVPLRSGDRWCAVSKRGKGQPVEILTTNPVHVYFRAVGRDADGSQKFKLPHDAFRTRYAPLKLADDRQRQMLAESRSRPAQSVSAPIPQPEPVEDDDPISAAVESVAAERVPVATPEPTPPPASPWEALRPKGIKSPKISAEQIREIWKLYHSGMRPVEIAPAYGVATTTVINIGKGRATPWATADLRAAAEAASVEPTTITEEEPVQVVTPKLGDDYQDMRDRQRQRQRALEQAAAEAEKVWARVPEVKVGGKQSTLVTDMADALEVLLEYAGKPLPRYLRLDLDALRGLIEQARSG